MKAGILLVLILALSATSCKKDSSRKGGKASSVMYRGSTVRYISYKYSSYKDTPAWQEVKSVTHDSVDVLVWGDSIAFPYRVDTQRDYRFLRVDSNSYRSAKHYPAYYRLKDDSLIIDVMVSNNGMVLNKSEFYGFRGKR
jgi:hypothetical protein